MFNEMQEEIARLKAIIAVYDEDKEQSKTELLNSIAAKLKAEYEDFNEAMNMEMTLELGENMRTQLRKIFKILKKSGIDIESR